MGRIATPSSLSQEIQSIYSAGGFSAGDYVYYTQGNGFGKLPATMTAATVTTLQACKSVVGGGIPLTTVTAQNGPTQILGTYTGATFTADSAKITADTSLSIASNYTAVESLLDGTAVVMYVIGTTVSLQRYTAAGAVLGSAVTVATNGTASPYGIALAATQDGGFVVAWLHSAGVTLQRYSAAGTTVGAPYTSSSSIGPSSSIQVKSLSDGRIILAWSNTSSYGYFAVFDSTITSILAGPSYIDSGNCTYPNSYIGLAPLLDGGFVFTWYDYNNGTGYQRRFNATYGGTTSGYSGIFSSGVSSCPMDDGGWIIVSSNAANLTVQRFNAAGALISYTTPSGPGGSNSWYSANGMFTVLPQPNGQFAILAAASSTYGYRLYSVRMIGGTAASPTYGSAVACSAQSWAAVSQPSTSNRAALQLDGSLLFSFAISSNIYMSARYTRGLINGVEYAGPSIVPTTYTLIGVALTDAPAGGSGKVITKGMANLNSSYRNVTTTMAFDYTQFSGIAGNSGTAIGRTVNLKGLA